MVSVIIVGAGKSTRFGSNKLMALLGGIPLIMRTIYAFQKHSEINEIILVVNQDLYEMKEGISKTFSKIKIVVLGGDKRQDSVKIGVEQASNEICLVHNGANPLVTAQEISAVIKAVKNSQVAGIARAVNSTIKQVENNKIVKTIDRSNLLAMETPQGFKKELFLKAINTNQANTIFTDEMSVLESIGYLGEIVLASPQNCKITTPYDLKIAEQFIMPYTRIGIGHDSHKFTNNSNKPLIIGGLNIPFTKSFQANSDGDVVIHALCNAIGTAIGEGSLSRYSDDMLNNEGKTNSADYLKHINDNMLARGYAIGNMAISIEGKEPKLEKHINDMKKNIAEYLNISSLQIGIAVTSGENLTSFGKGEGMQAFVYVQLIKM